MKLFARFTVRLPIYFFVIGASIFFPLFFGLPHLSGESRALLAVAVAIVAFGEIALFMYFEWRLLLKPMRTVAQTSKKLSSGDHAARIGMRSIDKDLTAVIIGINNIANEFENIEQGRKAFVANASHELRSPLTSIQGFLQAILDGTVAEEDREKYLQIVLGESKRLSTLISSMLDLSRLESEYNPLHRTQFDITALIRQVLQRFQPTLYERDISVSVVHAQEGIRVYADKDKIVQVLVNIIDNAVKYSPTHSRISVGTSLHGQKVYVSVKDNGEGISKKDQALIWDRFYMTDKSHTPTESKGTGLGLSIVKKIIDDHKEMIWVESSKGAGSTFIFTLSVVNSESAESSTQP